MKLEKTFIRKKLILKRKRLFSNNIKFSFNPLYNLIKKNFNKKIIIAGYYPANFEVNVLKFLKFCFHKGFPIVFPVVKFKNSMSFNTWNFKDPLFLNNFGILEPNKKNPKMMPDIILAPLVAFDKSLNRIGYGKGYYDRALLRLSKIKKTTTIGVAYSFQEYPKIPFDKHDIKLNYILTENGIIYSNKRNIWKYYY